MFVRSLLALLLALPVLGVTDWHADGLPDQWSVQEAPRVFLENDLYGYINGGSELFLEFGFERLRATRVSGPDGQITVDVYRMTDPVAALGIYLAKCSPETALPGVGIRHSGDRYQLGLLMGRHFIFITNTSGDPRLLPVMKAIAADLPAEWNRLAARLPEIPEEDLVPGSIRLARGPYALQPVYTFGDGDILNLAQAGTLAVIADYRSADNKTRTEIRVLYPDDAAAAGGFHRLVDGLDPYLDIVSSGEKRLVFKDYAGKFGLARLLDNQVIIGVHLDTIDDENSE